MGETPEKYDGQILVPFAVESSLSGVGKRLGDRNELWYNRTFTISPKWNGKRVLLHFGAVDWKADVWVNGVCVGTHTGGFTGYTFLDMTDELPKTAAHWAELGIHFDAVYTGFMGSEAQMDLVANFVRTFRRDRSTIFICDPVMGDHGKIYKTYTPAMCAGV